MWHTLIAQSFVWSKTILRNHAYSHKFYLLSAFDTRSVPQDMWQLQQLRFLKIYEWQLHQKSKKSQTEVEDLGSPWSTFDIDILMNFIRNGIRLVLCCMKANQIIAVLLSLEPNPNVICSQERENTFLWRTARKSSRPFWSNIEEYCMQTAHIYIILCHPHLQSVFLRRQNIIDLRMIFISCSWIVFDFQVILTVSEHIARSMTVWPEVMRCFVTSSTMQLSRRRTMMRCNFTSTSSSFSLSALSSSCSSYTCPSPLSSFGRQPSLWDAKLLHFRSFLFSFFLLFLLFRPPSPFSPLSSPFSSFLF